jgi:hypothetical protein
MIAALSLLYAVETSNLPAKGSPEQRALFESSQQRQHEFEQQQFVNAGFEPLKDVARAGRNVRRVMFRDPYGIVPIPGLELERAINGQIYLRLIGPQITDARVQIPESEWDRLRVMEAEVFAEPKYVPWNPHPVSSPPPPICHGWGVGFGAAEAGRQHSASWGECGSKEGDARLAYAIEMARLAVATRPACSFDSKEAFWSFSTCFATTPAGIDRQSPKAAGSSSQ